MSKIQSAKKIYRQEGPISLAKESGKYVFTAAKRSDYIPFLNETRYHQMRADNEYRWQFIQPHITDRGSCLDIGCATGYFTAKAAADGLLSLGVDDLSQNPQRLSNAWEYRGDKPNVGFGNWPVNPDNVGDLPYFDVILAMTVYHHFVKAFGIESAQDMLREVASSTNILVLEMPGWRWTGRKFTIEAKQKNNKEVSDKFEIQNHQLSPHGARIRPKLSEKLPPGKYDVTVHADGYESSNSLPININKDMPFSERPRVKFEKNNIEMVESDEDNPQNIDDVIIWYKNLIKKVLGDSVEIIDQTTTHRRENKLTKNVIFILDTEDIVF